MCLGSEYLLRQFHLGDRYSNRRPSIIGQADTVPLEMTQRSIVIVS